MPGFHLPAYAWLFALIVPLVVLYFLRLRRPSVDVSSLVLWRRVLDDHRVNAPFQRFKRNVLLWLQLLVLCLLVLAAMQPFLGGGQDTVTRLPIVIDCSASMAALDRPGGTTRLDLAKERARALIDGLAPEQEVSVIVFAGRARRVTDFTADRRRLLTAIDELAVEDEPSDVVDALRLAEALAQSDPFESLTLISDGNVPPTADFALPFRLNYELVPGGGANLGVVDLNAARADDGSWEVFARIAASAQFRGGALAELHAGDTVVARETITIGPNESRDLVFRLGRQTGERLPLRLVVRADGFDALAADDVAYLSLTSPRPIRVWLSPAVRWVAPFLREPGRVDLSDSAEPTDAADAIISHRVRDDREAVRVALFVDAPPPTAAGLFVAGEPDLAVVDWDRDDPLLRHVDLSDVLIQGTRAVKEGATIGDFESLGFTAAIESTGGPLLLAQVEPDRLRWYLQFDPMRSTLPYRLGFPIMLVNLLRATKNAAGLLGTTAARTGVLPALRAAPGTKCTVTTPSGRTWNATADAAGLVGGIPAVSVGRYEVALGDARRTIGVSLLDRRETRMAQVSEIEFREDVRVQAGEVVRAERPLWPVLAVLALAVLLLEWWFYQRRPGGV